MSTLPRPLTIVLVLALLALDRSAALAGIDATGSWFVGFDTLGSGFHLAVEQDGSTLAATAADLPLLPPLTGAIDVDSGRFALVGVSEFGESVMIGTVASDGRSFDATLGAPPIGAFDLTGSRCGNEIVDPGEACDDGNRSDRDCCSSICGLDPAGAACGPDDACATATCDGSGTCVVRSSLPDGAACDDANACSDGDACLDGRCRPGAARQCGACEHCDVAAGCVAGARPECLDSGSLVGGWTKVHVTSADDGARLTVQVREGAVLQPSGDFGDPTAKTEYRLCLFAGGFDTPAIATAVIPAGAVCDGRPCWTVTSTAARFRDRSAHLGGVTSIKLRSDGNGRLHSLALRGRHIPLSSSFPARIPVIVQLDGSDATCVGTYLDFEAVRRNDAHGFEGRLPARPQ